jgi:uncharacterized membrane protein
MDKGKIIALVTTIISLVFFAMISTFVPQDFIWIVFLLYALIFMSLSMSLPRILQRKHSDIKGATLLKADRQEVMKIMMKDQEIDKELKPQIIASLALITSINSHMDYGFLFCLSLPNPFITRNCDKA